MIEHKKYRVYAPSAAAAHDLFHMTTSKPARRARSAPPSGQADHQLLWAQTSSICGKCTTTFTSATVATLNCSTWCATLPKSPSAAVFSCALFSEQLPGRSDMRR